MRFFLLIIVGILNLCSAMAFQQPPVASINGKAISQGEFLYAFNKNRSQNEPLNYDSLVNYLDQYINFKLKVLAAEELGIDQNPTFINEYQNYISQVQKPYMQNPVSEEALVKEAYERLKYEINASHILIRIQNESNPMDSLPAYEKINNIRNEIINGADFAEMAKIHSQDGSAKDGGSLGWFTALAMVYPFENGAYKTAVGQVSEIIRSQFGYHIIKVNDKRKAKGKIKTSHIFLTKNGRSVESGNALIQTIYDSLNNGGQWKALVQQYTDDSQTKLNGGSLPFVGTGQLPDEFLNVAYSLQQPGEISKPVEASYGWHIIRLDAKEEIPPLESLRDELADKIRRSGRNQLSPDDLVAKLKKENGFEQDFPLLQNTIAQIASVGLPNLDLNSLSEKTILRIGNKELPYSLFFQSLGNANQITPTTLWNRYKLFEREQIILHEDEQATTRYPEYGYLMQEYKEGLMLFEIMERKIWNRAAEDSIGLQAFYESNQAKYSAPERAVIWVIESESEASLRATKDNISWKVAEDFEDQLESRLAPEVYGTLKIAKRIFERDDLPNFEPYWQANAMVDRPSEKRLYVVQEIIPRGFYRLEEIQGVVMSDYQNWLEEEWLKALRIKNQIVVNKNVLKQIASDEK